MTYRVIRWGGSGLFGGLPLNCANDYYLSEGAARALSLQNPNGYIVLYTEESLLSKNTEIDFKSNVYKDGIALIQDLMPE